MRRLKLVGPDGSMFEWLKELFRAMGMTIVMKSARTKEGSIQSSLIESVMIQRPQEIPLLLQAGYFDIGITGEDWLTNWGLKLKILLTIPVGRNGNGAVKIVLAVRKDSGINSARDLPRSCTIATEYVQLAKRYLKKIGRTDVRIMPSFGNTEQKLQFGATAIIDVTESGESMRANNIAIIETIMTSAMAIVVKPKIMNDPEMRSQIECFVRLAEGVQRAQNYVRIEANVPEELIDEASQIIGGMKGATISPLSVANWFALVGYVEKVREHQVIFALTQIGVLDVAVIRETALLMEK